MDETKLWKFIKSNTKASFKSYVDENNKPFNTIANKGLKEGEIAIRYGAEYSGFSIKALEYIKPILTSLRVSKAVRLLSEGNIQGAIVVLRIVNEVREEGIGLLYSVLKFWLEKNSIPIPNEYSKKAIEIKSNKLLKWINSHNYAPIQGKFEIADIGNIKTETVVPENWLGRVFNNADELHREMDKLDWRKGKPPVNFCCIYAMFIKTQKKWDSITNDVLELNIKVGVTIFPEFNNKNVLINLNSDVIFFNKKIEFTDWLKKLPKNCKVVQAGLQTEKPGEKILIACYLDKIIEKNPKYIKKRTVGILASRLQKLNRRGRVCCEIMKETMMDLWKSPNYNLPDQQFLKVSGGRQLLWRLFISTIEDVEPYFADKKSEYLSMLDLACLSVIANIDPNIQFNEPIFNKILLTGLLIQHNDYIGSNWPLHSIIDDSLEEEINNIKTNDPFLKSLKMLLLYMPSRSGDYNMLLRSFNYVYQGKYKLKFLENLSITQLLKFANIKEALAGELSGYDMIAIPNILIQLQASLPFLPYDFDKHSTKALSHFIWNNSSAINVRNPKEKTKDPESLSILDILIKIQMQIKDPNYYKINLSKYEKNLNRRIKDNYLPNKNKIKETDSRLGFLLLFGQKTSINYKGKKVDIIVAGSKEAPCKVKSISKTESEYLEGNDRFLGEIGYVQFLNQSKILVDCPLPPIGYHWIWNDKKKIHISAKIIKSDDIKLINNILFYAEEIELEPFDTSTILIRHPIIKPLKIPNNLIKILEQAFYFSGNYKYDNYEINLIMRKFNERILPLFDWVNIAEKSNMPDTVWKSAILKLYNNYNNEALMGPVDSGGNKLKDSINYLYEGTIMRIFNILSMIYPNVIIPKTSHKYYINTTAPEYIDLLEKLNQLAYNKKIKIEKKYPKKIIVKTKLWEHQQKTVDRIFKEITLFGKTGFGDASNVGAGKTLTALSLMANLYNYNIKQNITSHSGFLVLLPTTYLYNTWIDEINKHIEGFEIVTQNANGTLNGELKINSVLITTLGRMREHPLSQSWIFIVIDECLSVQNKSALQTEEAFKQIISSQYKCILLSATFFRARFDKLFYMLKMLASGLPETKIYLDTILSERIVSNQPTKIRLWLENITKFKLSPNARKEYDLLQMEGFSSEILYAKLTHFLNENFNYIKAFRQIIKKAQKRRNRCLIYGKSKKEADDIAENIKGVSRFPDITGTHVSISLTEGTYGLNNLILLDCIVSHIPQSDRIPQMKGRLDRYGQKKDKLYIEYLVVENTIEEAQLFLLELEKNFFKNYILPLSSFYELAVGRKSKHDLFN